MKNIIIIIALVSLFMVQCSIKNEEIKPVRELDVTAIIKRTFPEADFYFSQKSIYFIKYRWETFTNSKCFHKIGVDKKKYFDCMERVKEKYEYVRREVGFEPFFYITVDEKTLGELFLKISDGKFIQNDSYDAIFATVKTWSDNNGISLSAAASRGDYSLALKLINSGAKINEGGNSTPLLSAAFYGHSDVVKLLLEHGANPDGSEKETFSPLVVASGGSFLEVEFPDIVEMLLKYGADPNRAHNGKYPLDFARKGCLYEVISILEKYNAKDSEKYKNMEHCPDRE